MKDINLQWIAKGNTGCNFASVFAKNPELVGWVRIINPDSFFIPADALIVSYVFENGTKETVRQWALDNGFFEEQTSDNTAGLRFKRDGATSWVQYFGQDSHVPTRRTPHAELLMCVKLPAAYYVKVGFKGILHLAHGSIKHLKQSVVDKMWETSFKRTKKLLGHEPTIIEAAKTTFCNE